MENLTLIIPAKKEKESLPLVLNELKNFEGKIFVVLEKSDVDTIKSVENYQCKIFYQTNKGYGDALIQGIRNVNTEYFCIFNADGSFSSTEIIGMYNKLISEKIDLVFGSRYEKKAASEDDTLITLIGNYIFTMLGKIFFKLPISDILYTFVIGKTLKAKDLNLERKDFSFCVEFPIKAKRLNMKMKSIASYERKRIAGIKKVKAFKDGLIILIYMIKLFFLNK